MHIYITTYNEDYIWHKIKPDPKYKQKATCKRLSIPKFIRKKYQKLKSKFSSKKIYYLEATESKSSTLSSSES